ncbi:PepSY-associated TM helix domain-containing protein [Arcobacteraceae bacterium]|nr:PepSY-associated TM helix domain-containing protein [Arcobacteraceae bacterium]
MTQNKSKAFKQRLLQVHSSVGITVSLLMYISIFFGIFTIFSPYIHVWEKPSRHFEIKHNEGIDYTSLLSPIINDPSFPNNNVIIKLPEFKSDPTLQITHRFVDAKVFNPNTEKELKDEGVNSQLSYFLNLMHQGQPIKFYGRIIYGFVAVAVMFLIIGGILLLLYSQFNNNANNQQSKFSTFHRKIFLWISIPLLIVTISGALMNIGYKGGGLLAYLLSNGEESNIYKLVKPVLSPNEEILKRLNIEAKMLPIGVLLNKARNVNPELIFEELILLNWKDITARIQIIGYNPTKPFLNGVYNRPKIILNAVDGSVLKNVKVLDRQWGVLLTDALYFLHLLFGVGILTKILVLITMIFSCFGIGFGVMLWLEKRAKKFDGKIVFYHWMGKLSLAIMIGVFLATAILFNLQWILPFDMNNRILVQESIFYLSWLATLPWSYFRINSYIAAKEFLFVSGILFIISSLLHCFVSGFTYFELYQKNMMSILWVDIGLVLLGCSLLFTAYILPKDRMGAKLFWNKK